jgi:hypothetical protein
MREDVVLAFEARVRPVVPIRSAIVVISLRSSLDLER